MSQMPPSLPQPLNYQTPPGNVYPAPYQGPLPDQDAKSMGMLCHLLGIFTGFLGPLIIWLIKKDQSPFVNDQGKEALNFQITMILAILCVMPFCIVPFLGACLIGLVAMTVTILRIVFCIIATVQTNNGIAYRYPIILRLIK